MNIVYDIWLLSTYCIVLTPTVDDSLPTIVYTRKTRLWQALSHNDYLKATDSSAKQYLHDIKNPMFNIDIFIK